jgi:hypothetical protein
MGPSNVIERFETINSHCLECIPTPVELVEKGGNVILSVACEFAKELIWEGHRQRIWCK